MTTAHVHGPAHVLPGIDWLAPAALLAVLVAAYLALVARRRRVMGRGWSRRRTAAWVAGASLLAVAVSPRTVGGATSDAAGHMVQHLLLGMYAPLGLVLAAPVTLLLGASSPAYRRRIAGMLGSAPVRVLSHPLVAGLVNVGSLYVLYLTGLYAASTRTPVLHLAVNVHFVVAGSIFAWAVAGPDPAPHRPGMRTRVVALVLSAAGHAYLAKTLYAGAGTLPPGGLHTATDVQQAAQWMYYGGDVAELALAVALFAAWYRDRGRSWRPAAAAGATG